MAKDGWSPELDLEPYAYTNPVSGAHKIFFRKKHDLARSPRLAAFERCMHVQLESHTYRGGGPAQDETRVRQAFREAVNHCKQADKLYPSDRDT